MKKLALYCMALLACALFLLPAAAETADAELIRLASAMLTEVYGYTQDEADAFTYDMSDGGSLWNLRFYQNPDWVYTMTARKSDLQWQDAQTPFVTQYERKASENSVRYILRAVADNGWFTDWNAQSKAELTAALAWCDVIRVADSLERGLASEDYTPAQALQDFFRSCYGEEAQWSPAVSQWRDAAFASFGLMREETVFSIPRGITERTETGLMKDDEIRICEYAGVVPDALAEAFSNPRLGSWRCLAGAYEISQSKSGAGAPAGTGLAAFANGDSRLLVRLYLDADTKVWHTVPVGETALLSGRDLYITYSGADRRFTLHYPVSDTEEESFLCRLAVYYATADTTATVCELVEYRHTDLAQNASLVIDSGFGSAYSGWYTVTATKNGTSTQKQYLALVPGILEYVDADAFPRTAEACEQAVRESAVIPQGYGLTQTLHLREKTSSHSKDLGLYLRGTLVEVLDTLPGTAYPWYRVRIGNAEGYMSSNYVDYHDGMKSLPTGIAPCLGKTKGGTALKNQMSGLSQTVADLPEGTLVRVLAECGNWLHVSVPANADDWLMQPGEVCGYLKSGAITQGVTAQQIDWALAE